MKKILLSLVVLVCATVSFAQSQIATLSQDETIKTFYGSGSFAEAMNAAKHGDVITLSSGTFSSTTITKAVTLRGTGMLEVTDSTEFFAPTIIEGSTTIDVIDTIPQHLEVEGIKFGETKYSSLLKNAVFKKCNFYTIGATNTSSKLTNAVLLGCRVRYSFNLIGTVSCINSILCYPRVYGNNYYNTNNTFEFTNCVIHYCYPYELPYCRFKNSYIDNYYTSLDYSSHDVLSSTCVVNNCVSNVARTFNNSINPTNKVCAIKDFFTSSSSVSSIGDGVKYTLTDSAASTYLGDDGTQVGIYGGNLPYEEKVAIPRITKCVVAGKSTTDGKLSVDIQVEAVQ